MTERLPSRPFTRKKSVRMWRGFLIAVIHALPIWFLIAGPSRTDWLLFAVIYPFQGIGVVIGLHRYFAHHCFSTSRGFQFFLALCAASTFGDPIGFAGKHRLHHRHTDQQDDPHTPRHGFWYCWFGSLLDNGYTDEELVEVARDLKKYPELMLLHRFWLVPGLLLCLMAFLIGGVSGVAIGVLLGSTLLMNQASAVNYFCHKYGNRRFETNDQSTNNALVAILSYGEGWHNNHHQYPTTAKAGFRWWEIDMYYWVIYLFSKLGLVWDVRQPPQEMMSKAAVTEN